jgi:hypothetical protein
MSLILITKFYIFYKQILTFLFFMSKSISITAKSIIGSFFVLNLVLISGLNISSANIKVSAEAITDKDFNANYLLSDESFSTHKIFPNERSIQEYLDKVNSPLRNYSTEGAKASHWIYTAANGITSSAYNVKPNLNPGMLLAYLEKEQSLLSLSSYDTSVDNENRIKTAMGFGCPDDAKCSDKYKGFVNQLNYASYQLQYNYNVATKNLDNTYKVGATIKSLDDKKVYLSNAATSAAYRYTPHVFYSGFNLWKIMTDNNWGATGKGYQGDYSDYTSSNVKLNSSFAVNFDDDEVVVTSTNPVTAFTVPTKSNVIEIKSAPVQAPIVVNNQNNFVNNVVATPQYTSPNGHSFELTAPSPSAYTTDNCEQLKNETWVFGTISDDVEKLQRCMQKLGIFNWINGATGYFGDVTKKALAEWRK